MKNRLRAQILEPLRVSHKVLNDIVKLISFVVVMLSIYAGS